jgi:hypothetical protein
MFNRRTLRAFGLTFFLLAATVALSNIDVLGAVGDWFVVEGHGVSIQQGATKYFSFSARQSLLSFASSRPATGFVKIRQFSDVWGNFSLRGRVTCVGVVGNRAVIGAIILNGDGTAAGQVGKTFRLFLIDGDTTNDADRLDNSGYETGVPDCSQPTPWPSGGLVLEDGDIAINR